MKARKRRRAEVPVIIGTDLLISSVVWERLTLVQLDIWFDCQVELGGLYQSRTNISPSSSQTPQWSLTAMKEKADPANMVACNAKPGPMVLSFLIYRLQMRIPAGTVAAIIATIAVCQPIFLDRQLRTGTGRGETYRGHGPLYHASGRQNTHLLGW